MSAPRKDEAGTKLQQYSSRLLIVALSLTLLYVGRIVLIPLALALMLSLLVAPLVRAMRRIRIPRTWSVLLTVATLAIACAAIAGALGLHILRIARSMPQYEITLQRKLEAVDEVTLGQLPLITREANRLVSSAHASSSAATEEPAAAALPPPAVRLQPREVSSLGLLGKALASLWVPLQTVGIVLLVLTFVLLEHEILRDRFIRIVGATDIRAATLALNDAGERLSRYFVSQFLVNLAFGLTIWATLEIMHVPQAMLCGALAAVLRFVPYVGVGLAALLATALAFAVDPGWSLTVGTLATFVGLDILVGQLLEPHLYGHATGLSPLSVVIAAIFWSALWGPVGLILSTPLTLCLLVAGRHMKGLGILELLLGEARPLTLSQHFYQRALSGDAQEILSTAREFLKRESLPTYCDRVLVPALHLAQLDAEPGATSREQQLRIRRVITDVVASLCQDAGSGRPRARGSVLDDLSAAQWLRQQRERSSGRWQGPIGVPAGSIVICAGLGSSADDLVAELLVRLLRRQQVDARHFSPRDVDMGLPPGADPAGVSIIYLTSAFPSPEREHTESIAKQFQALLPHAHVMTLFCLGVGSAPRRGASSIRPTADSVTEALLICAAWRQGWDRRDTPDPRKLSAARSLTERRRPRGEPPPAHAPASPSR